MNVHEFLDYRMEKTAKENKSFGRFKQGVKDMIVLPTYKEGLTRGAKKGAKRGALVGAGITAPWHAYNVIGGGLHRAARGQNPLGILADSVYLTNAVGLTGTAAGVGAGVGAPIGAALGAKDIKIRRALAKSRRMKALAALGAGGAGLGVMSAMRKKKK